MPELPEVETVRRGLQPMLEGATIEAYHGAIFGVPHAHLRWADPAHLEYEIAVTRSAAEGNSVRT